MNKVLLFGVLVMVLMMGREVKAESDVVNGNDSGNVQSAEVHRSAGQRDTSEKKIVKRHRKIRRHIRHARKHHHLRHRRPHKAQIHIHVR